MKIIARFPQMVLGFALAYAGIGHLTTSRTEFQAQVPSVFADYADFVVLASGRNLLGQYFSVHKWR
jgi:hypothetical protein